VILWDVRAGRPLGPPGDGQLTSAAADNVRVSGPRPRALAFNPAGNQLASGGEDGTVALWDVNSRTLVWPAAKAHRLPVQTLAFSPDGRILASAAVGTADYDGTVRFWDT